MGVGITLTDRELPVSPVFIDFIDQWMHGTVADPTEWADQRLEGLSVEQDDVRRRALAAAPRVVGDPVGRGHIARAYGLLLALLSGDVAPIRELQFRFHFINVIGIPRSGGSYLTAELFRALGHDPQRVPSAIAHDGFPDAGPFEFTPGANSWIQSLQTMGEYLTMVELFFAKAGRHSGKVVVPKKLTKGIYAGGFFHRILGEAVEHVLTLRHPLAACVSTYEKSGGLPADGRFLVRSNIEEWARRDLVYTGCTSEQLAQMDYFDVYLRYWEQYHLYVATTGLSANRDLRVIVYGRQRLEALAQSFHRRYDSVTAAGEFSVSDRARKLHPQWLERAQPAIARVAASFGRVGIPFPLEELMESW